jgi:hypothetical protein
MKRPHGGLGMGSREIWFSLIAPLFLLAFSSCSKPPSYEVVLYQDESLNRGETVYLENQPIGFLSDIIDKGEGTAVGLITLERREYQKLIVVGTERSSEKNRIVLVGPNDGEDRTPLLPMSIIQAQTQAEAMRHQWVTVPNILLTLASLVAIVLLFWIIKNVFHIVVTLACLLIAGAASYYLYPLGIPHAQELLNQLTKAAAEHPDMLVSYPSRPDPALVSLGSIFISTFIAASILVGAPLKKLMSRNS